MLGGSVGRVPVHAVDLDGEFAAADRGVQQQARHRVAEAPVERVGHQRQVVAIAHVDLEPGARAEAWRASTGEAVVPGDAITASASGLDPHISLAGADVQIARVARARNLDPKTVREIVAAHTQGPQLGFLGQQRVNVLELNLALDAQQ